MKIKKVIMPVAGSGTRFLPATKAQPKEMLSVVDKPVIQYLVEEAVAAGIKEIIFVTGRGKRAIEDHFDASFELEHTLGKNHKKKLLREIRRVAKLAKFSYVRQPEPLGDGHAILCARHLISKGEPVAVMFGDDLVDSRVPTIKQLTNIYEKYGDPVIALARVPKEDVSKFGVVDPVKLSDRTYEIKKFVEKPKIKDAPSNLIAVGKYIITPEVFDKLEESQNDKGEIRLANAFIRMIKYQRPIYGYEFEGVRYDCGNKFGFIQATIQMGLKHPEVKNKLRKYLKSLKV